MPSARLIEKSEVQPRSRRGNSVHAEQERAEARNMLLQAKGTGKAIELSLDHSERGETIKARYRKVAAEESLNLRFQTGKQRTYTSRKGNKEIEAEVLIVLVS